MKLNQKQSAAMKKVISGRNLLISGPGGVGKSVLVREIKDHFESSTLFLAPTGIAALNISGATIHSVFKFPFNVLWKKEHSNINDKTRDLLKKEGPVKRIVIDEISMVRVDLLHAIDQQLRKIRRLNIPFGGIQIIAVGDFFQLPPVLTNRDKDLFDKNFDSPFAFSDSTWAGADFEYVELDEVMRQDDQTFIKHLMNIRTKAPGFEDSVGFFNHRGMANQEGVLDNDPVFLNSTNRSAEAVNEMNYHELEGKEHVFNAVKEGRFSTEPSPSILRLKYGTKVMFTTNSDTYKNGQVGYVVDFVGKNAVTVLMEDTEEELFVTTHRWEEMDYTIGGDGGVSHYPVGSYKQLPLKHGWAATIHKCQGQTLNYGIIDVGRGAFCHGQTYVALSRMRSLDGLALFSKLSPRDIIVSDEVKEFYDNGCRGIGLF